MVWFTLCASCLQCDKVDVVAQLIFLCVKKVSKYLKAERSGTHSVKVKAERFSSYASEKTKYTAKYTDLFCFFHNRL